MLTCKSVALKGVELKMSMKECGVRLISIPSMCTEGLREDTRNVRRADIHAQFETLDLPNTKKKNYHLVSTL
jgi:hypothetical protein